MPERIKDGLPPIAVPSTKQIVGKAGDAVLCHSLLMHEGHQNLSPSVRYAAFFNMRHMDHERQWAACLTDIWLEWPGLPR